MEPTVTVLYCKLGERLPASCAQPAGATWSCKLLTQTAVNCRTAVWRKYGDSIGGRQITLLRIERKPVLCSQ